MARPLGPPVLAPGIASIIRPQGIVVSFAVAAGQRGRVMFRSHSAHL
jgi:hypothetical protein